MPGLTSNKKCTLNAKSQLVVSVIFFKISFNKLRYKIIKSSTQNLSLSKAESQDSPGDNIALNLCIQHLQSKMLFL